MRKRKFNLAEDTAPLSFPSFQYGVQQVTVNINTYGAVERAKKIKILTYLT